MKLIPTKTIEELIPFIINPPKYVEPKPQLPFIKITPDELMYLDSIDNVFKWNEEEKILQFYCSLCKE